MKVTFYTPDDELGSYEMDAPPRKGDEASVWYWTYDEERDEDTQMEVTGVVNCVRWDIMPHGNCSVRVWLTPLEND